MLPDPRSYRPLIMGRRGAVATNHPLATQAGFDVLRAGGNAVDASVAICFTLGVVEPMMSGIGGDGFYQIALAGSGEGICYNGTGAAPEQATVERYRKEGGIPVSGPLSTMLMPLLAATAAFGLARSGQVLLRATIGMALGFAYFVADNFSLAMGNVGAYPPIMAAWAPFVLFLLIGETVLIRSEE